MPSLFQNIRGALQTQAAIASGFPVAAQRSYEGHAFSPTPGTPWAKMTLMPQTGRAAVIGGQTKLHRGLFQVDVFDPLAGGVGTGAAEAKADAVKAAFEPGTVCTLNGERVVIQYAERKQALFPPGNLWVQVPVTVAWYCYSPNN